MDQEKQPSQNDKKEKRFPRLLSSKRYFRKHSSKRGLPPGSPVFVGDKDPVEIKITIFSYNEDEIDIKETTEIPEILDHVKQPNTVTWVNIDGLRDLNLIENLCKELDIHSLTIEDILNTEQRPKIDDFGDYLYMVMKMLFHGTQDNELVFEQISIILGKTFVLSFQEMPGDILDVLRDRIKQKNSRIRRSRADYLLYSIIDVIIDNYFHIIEQTSDQLEILEDRMIESPTPETLKNVYSLKTDLIFLRKAIWPLRDIISNLEKRETPLIEQTTQKYIRDVYDHVIQVIDILETQRDLVAGLLDLYLSSVSNKMNEVMKVLTIIATITIPMTVISGIYGMNFIHMPETGWIFGYPFALGLMAIIAIVMILYFKEKEWL